MQGTDPLRARSILKTPSGEVAYFRLAAVADQVTLGFDRMPFVVKIFLENALRNAGANGFTEDDVRALAGWQPGKDASREFPFLPARVILQDFTGIPCVVDLAAMREGVRRLGGDPKRINPIVPVDLVIDHSVQVDAYGSEAAFLINVEREYERNGERYALLRWAQQAFDNFRVVPPGTGIVHQVNLEYLAGVVWTSGEGAQRLAYPDSLVGTDSHTTMINGLGVLGWGVGGIEAEAVMLGQPITMLTPDVVGFRISGAPPEGVTATDLVLTVTQMLRKVGVVERFVEFFGPGLRHLSLADRATISNMSPEFGATASVFPIDDETLRYLRTTGRPADQVALVEAYAKEQGLFRTDASPEAVYNQIVDLDLSTLEPSVAGPRRPQDRVLLGEIGQSFHAAYPQVAASRGEASATSGGTATMVKPRTVPVSMGGESTELKDGSVVIAAITSCTNTSNPRVMVGAGLLAKKAVERGLKSNPAVKTSLAPGSGVVTAYLERAGLMRSLKRLGFHVVGYGCTTCIGNSGPLPDPVSAAIKDNELVVCAVLSGNRNFEGRIHPQVRASYLASPPLVVAFALTGTVEIDLTTQPIGQGKDGQPVFLKDIWPTSREIDDAIAAAVTPALFSERYDDVFRGDDQWRELPVPSGDLYRWDADSTYVRKIPFFDEIERTPNPIGDIDGARVLVFVGDSVTTDHISPAGSIAVDSPAGRYFQERGVAPRDFNSYGARRGNHEVMMRGTFANIRLRNVLADGKEGNWTKHIPGGDVVPIYDAAMRYAREGVPLIVLAGKEYGSGSSRDWAAKGPALLGVRAAIAESFERIHRSNLVGMGILPLQYRPGENAQTLGLTGHESFAIRGLSKLTPGATLTVQARRSDGTALSFDVVVRIDSPTEIEYYRHGGILPFVLRRLATQG
ncbi:MAG: aconitate hydratase AcnA [Armatimonadetes bacterium]|nr:aconitate hydratase AcnA [Armatimonadota bacterium]